MTYDSDYEVRLATLEAMGGDVTKHFDSVYEIDLEILDIVQHGGGGGGAVIDDDHVSTATTWSSSKIVSELADAGFDVEIVTELPTTGDAHTIYFIASSSSQTGNVYDEYMYINSNWEQVGSTAVDLSNYYTKSEVDTALSAKADEADLADYATWNVVNTSLGLKQDTLTAGTNITIANNVISAASTDLSNYYNKTEVDTALAGKVDDSDLNSYYNKTEVDTALAGKQDTLTAGTNITIQNNVISATGTGGADVVELTQAEYDALPTASKNNGKIYSITDATIITPMTKAQADTYYNPINTVTANSGNYKFPNWNANGQITGQAAQAYQISESINGTSKTVYATATGNLPSIYAPTSAGTAGQYLVSSGSGDPVWQNLEVASDYVIADADASAGTYSSDIAAFYTKTISENIVQGVQIKITDEHVVDNDSVYSDSYYLPSSSRIYSGNVELWLMTTEDGVTWENIHYLITGNSITRTVTTGNFGPVNA